MIDLTLLYVKQNGVVARVFEFLPKQFEVTCINSSGHFVTFSTLEKIESATEEEIVKFDKELKNNSENES